MKTFCFFLLMLVSLSLSAQSKLSTSNKKAIKSYELAGQFLFLNQVDKALEELKQATNADPGFIEAYYLLGDIYRKIQKFKEAKENYATVLNLNPDFDAALYFNIGECELKTGDYQPALVHLKKYSQQGNISEIRKGLLKKYLADAEFSIEAVKKPVPFAPQNLGTKINSSVDEYLPVVTANESTLIFTRKANNNEDFFVSVKENNSWAKAQYLSWNINTNSFNEGAQCVSPDGRYLFFTGCNRPDGKGRCDIYVCHREGGDWSKPFNLGSPVNGNTWESQPSISADGRTLYFVSSRPGGLGGFDIWKSNLLENGEWAEPENLGPNINTPFDEESAFIHPDGKTLYFSSKGWTGLGGRDLFLSHLDNAGKWQQPVNLGYPINTFKDEGGLTISTDGSTAYFSSDQEGSYGGLDIYTFKVNENIKPAPVTYVTGLVIDAQSKKPLNASIKVSELDKNEVIYEDISDISGSFLATMPLGKEYALSVEKEGYLFHSENFKLKDLKQGSEPFTLEIQLHKILVGNSVVLNNVFFESNKYNLLPQSKTELSELINFLKNNPQVNIEIGGHTDNIGNDNANLLLSENRAKSVYNFLISNKIPASRLTFKGYGKNKPVTGNANDAERRLNRRTEIKVVKN